MTEPHFFTAKQFRAWLQKNHKTKTEVVVGFYKRGTNKPTMTWSEAVDQALCFGWIDGVRRSIDKDSYCNRFTPRRPTSNWSQVNIKKVAELKKAGLMTKSGEEAFAKRKEQPHGTYSYEQRGLAKFSAAQQREFKAHKEAWAFFSDCTSSYKKMVTWWVTSARKEETQTRRLQKLIDESAHHRRIS